MCHKEAERVRNVQLLYALVKVKLVSEQYTILFARFVLLF